MKKWSKIKYKISKDSLSLSEVKMYLRDGSFWSDVGIVNLHPSNGTHWVACIKEIFFGTYGVSPPHKLSRFFIKRNEFCLYSEYKLLGLDSFCAAYCLSINFITKVLGIYSKSALLNFYYQSFSSNESRYGKVQLTTVLNMWAKLTNCGANKLKNFQKIDKVNQTWEKKASNIKFSQRNKIFSEIKTAEGFRKPKWILKCYV